MVTKLNEKLEFLRSGSEQDLLKQFKKNKALINRLCSVRKKSTRFSKRLKSVYG